MSKTNTSTKTDLKMFLAKVCDKFELMLVDLFDYLEEKKLTEEFMQWIEKRK